MNPFALFLMALFSPFLIAATLFLPTYSSIALSTYIIYDRGAKVHPLADKLYDVFYILDVYGHLFTRWSQHMGNANILNYTLPLIGFPLIGLMLSYWLTSKLSIRLHNIFRSGMH